MDKKSKGAASIKQRGGDGLLPSLAGLQQHRHLLCEYYTVNLLACSTYLLYRLQYTGTELELGKPLYDHVTPFDMFEFRVACACGAYACVQAGYRTRSLDNGVATVFFWLQAFVLGMALCTNAVSCFTYGLVFLLSYMLLSQPRYSGPDKVDTLTTVMLNELLADETDKVHVLYAYTTWSSESSYMYATYARLSIQYSTPKIKFTKMNMSEWPSVAKRLGVDASHASKELPSVVLILRGEKVGQLPRKTAHRPFTRQDMVRDLELDLRFACSMTAECIQQPDAATTKQH